MRDFNQNHSGCHRQAASFDFGSKDDAWATQAERCRQLCISRLQWTNLNDGRERRGYVGQLRYIAAGVSSPKVRIEGLALSPAEISCVHSQYNGECSWNVLQRRQCAIFPQRKCKQRRRMTIVTCYSGLADSSLAGIFHPLQFLLTFYRIHVLMLLPMWVH